jgi:hypothetical protein
MMIVNDNSRVVNKLEVSLTTADDARVIIYNCQMFIVQATGAYLTKLFSFATNILAR